MKRFLALALIALCGFAADTSAQAPAGNPAPATAMTQDSVNVFRRFSADRAKELAFYSEVIGLQAGPGFNMPGGGQMAILNIGTSQFKFTGAGNRQEKSGPVLDVTGLRVFSYFYCSEADVTTRLTSHGYPAPEFHTIAGRRSAMVTDPDGQWVELVVTTCTAPHSHFEVGATVTDVQKSRAFYREFVGLEELPPVDSPFGKTYRFRLGAHSTNILNLWAAHLGASANTYTAGIQYVISDVDAVDARAKANTVTITQPLGMFGQGLKTVWLADPDGITTYFAQILRTSQRQ
jgi:predicted enzyme related to lactoylglutathione lyase